MFILQTYSSAVIFCVITMLCWGSWANTQKLAGSSWRFELFYWDYVFGILLMALVLALTLGSSGQQGRSFLADYAQADAVNIRSALLGGIVFNAANILLVAAISIAGMSVAFPVGIGIALVLGVIINYVSAPQGNPVFLFAGIGLIALAIVLNASAYKKTSSVNQRPSARGLFISVAAGVLMSFFYRFVAASMFPDFTQPIAGRLSPYTAMVFFAGGVLISNFLFNTYIMLRPLSGTRLRFSDYFSGGFFNHLTGIIGGMIWCVGMSFSVLASDKAGTAISYGLGQGATVVAAAWGIFIWREFKNAPKGVDLLLNLMLLLYIAGIAMVIYAR
ncbi:MAG: multidrug DMT transporter permease [Bacteroidota bacterium]|nr:multidrug DMT transporter permease [Bacteroidota bacterium]